MALQKGMEKVAGAEITYQRGKQFICGVKAVRARSTFVTDDQAAGATIEATAQDFIVPIGVLWLGTALIVPQPGDKITVEVPVPIFGQSWSQTATETFEVMQPPYSPADSVGQRIRIHTKRVC